MNKQSFDDYIRGHSIDLDKSSTIISKTPSRYKHTWRHKGTDVIAAESYHYDAMGIRIITYKVFDKSV